MAIRFVQNYTSLNGCKFELQIWDAHYTGGSPEEVDLPIGEGGPVLTWDADGDLKYNDIMPSTLEWNYVINNTDTEEWIESIITQYEEKDVYVHLYQMDHNTGTNEYLWGGFLLMDLSTTPDASFPYDVSLRAIDGLALLKEHKWLVPGATGHTTADTYIPLGKQPFTYWFSEALYKIGAAMPATGAATTYEFCTVNRWYNDNHSATSNLTDDPTKMTECTTRGFYQYKDNGDWEPANTYDVLVGMLKSWGMRLIYWQNMFHFIQINEYIEQEVGTIQNPSNMMTHVYYFNGIFKQDQVYLGNNYFSRYQLYLDQTIPNDGGMAKLAGSEYTYLPAIKNSIVEFESIEDINYWQGYPDMFSEAQLAAADSGNTHVINSKPLGVWTNPHNGGGWYFYLVMNLAMNVTNASANNCGAFCYEWTIRARQDGTTPWTYMLKYDITANTLSWISYSSGYDAWNPTSLSDIITNTNMGEHGVICIHDVTPSAQNYNQDTLVFNSSMTTNTRIPAPTWSATGDWEFEIACPAVSQGGVQPANGWMTNGGGRKGLGNASSKNFQGPGLSIPMGMVRSNAANSECMGVTYTDSVGAPLPNGAINYNTVFSAIMTASNNIGYTMQNTFVSTLTTDSKTNVVQGVKYGDTTSPNAPGTLFTVNKSTGLITATEPLGEWGRSVIGGTDTFSELLAKQVINNQYHSNPCINGTIMTSKLDKFMYVDPSFSGIRQLNPIARIVDRDLNPYVFMRGAWSTAMDEWTGSWWGVINSTTSTVTNGSTGGPDDPGNDDGPTWEGLQKPPSSNVQALSSAGKIGRFDGTLQQDDFPDKFFITTTDQITSAGTITSIPTNTIRDYNGESYAMLKKGMSLLIIDTEYEGRNGVLHLHEVVVSADQVAGATEIYIESYVLGSDIAAGMKVEINFEALMDQQEITLTTTGTSGAATLVGDVLNVPVYSGGGTIQNFSWCDCTGTTSTSATDGEVNAVVVRYDTEKITSAVDNITLYGVGGVAGVSGSAFCFSMGPDAKYEVSWNVCTEPDVAINRILVGVKLQKGVVRDEAMTWTDYDPTHSYIYDRGISGASALKKGSTSNTCLIHLPELEEVEYWRVVMWKDESSNSSTTGITVLNGTSLIIKEI